MFVVDWRSVVTFSGDENRQVVALLLAMVGILSLR